MSGPRLHRLGNDSSVEAQLAVGHVLDHQEAVEARELDERRAAIGRETDTGRVLMIRNRVEELRPEAVGKPLLQLRDVETVLVEG